MKVRIGNIECRFSQGHYEIIKWRPNSYFGSEERLLGEGYERIEFEGGGFAFRNKGHQIDGSCFKNPESCYTVATLHYDRGEGCCDLKTVGPRLLDLKKQDRKDFFKVYKISEKYIGKEFED